MMNDDLVELLPPHRRETGVSLFHSTLAPRALKLYTFWRHTRSIRISSQHKHIVVRSEQSNIPAAATIQGFFRNLFIVVPSCSSVASI